MRLVQHDAVEVLCYMIPPDTFDAVHVFFPDPWPKKRHHKRRLLQPPLVALLVARMKSGAYLHVATDWQEYAEYVLAVLKNNPFPKAAGNRTVAIFLDTPPASAWLAGVKGWKDEKIGLGVREIYVHYGDGMGQSKLVIPAAKVGTARNINTIATLAKMANEFVLKRPVILQYFLQVVMLP